jgi:hypothetical protein
MIESLSRFASCLGPFRYRLQRMFFPNFCHVIQDLYFSLVLVSSLVDSQSSKYIKRQITKTAPQLPKEAAIPHEDRIRQLEPITGDVPAKRT